MGAPPAHEGLEAFGDFFAEGQVTVVARRQERPGHDHRFHPAEVKTLAQSVKGVLRQFSFAVVTFDAIEPLFLGDEKPLEIVIQGYGAVMAEMQRQDIHADAFLVIIQKNPGNRGSSTRPTYSRAVLP